MEILACPHCLGELLISSGFECQNCRRQFPMVEGVPILINEENSLFKIEDFTEKRETTYKKSSVLKKILKQCIPSLNLNVKSAENFQKLLALLHARADNQCVLVIGGAIEGEGFDAKLFSDKVMLVETDVAFGERTNLVCDAHDLPFKNETFDVVIAQAVLEHVLDPQRCVSEIERVLKKDGLVYAETPFIQQVHAGRFDFTRFTHLGHRRLFRKFEEIESGAACGAGMALAWSYCYFLQSFFSRPSLRRLAFAFGSLTGFWLKYFDYFLIDKAGNFDAASSFYFLGRKSDEILEDKVLIKGYRGLLQ